MSNVFVDNFNKIKKGENFEDLLVEYREYLNGKQLTFYDLYNFAYLFLGINITINITREEHITYNFHDFIIPDREVTIGDKIPKECFFKDSFHRNDLTALLEYLENFYVEREDYDIDELTSEMFSFIDEKYESLIGLVMEHLKQSDFFGYDIDENNILQIYEDFIDICKTNFTIVTKEVQDYIDNDVLFVNVSPKFKESDFIELFLVEIMGCKEFKPKRRGNTSAIYQTPFLNGIYIHNLKNEKVAISIGSEEVIRENFKLLF